MLTNIKTLSLMMLSAGLALGVFAGTLIAEGPRPVVRDLSRVDAAIEARVEFYREAYDLDALQTDQVRRILTRHRQRIHDEIMGLWRENQHRFEALQDLTMEQLEAIIGPIEDAEGAERK